jgi:hypothetical protein
MEQQMDRKTEAEDWHKEHELAERMLDGRDWLGQFAKAPLSKMGDALRWGDDALARRMSHIASLDPELAVPAFELGADRLQWPQLVDFAYKSRKDFAVMDHMFNDACMGPEKGQGSMAMWAPRARSQQAVALIGVSAGLALRALGWEWLRKTRGGMGQSARFPYQTHRIVETADKKRLEENIAAIAPVLSDWMASWLSVEKQRAARFDREVLEGKDGLMALIGFMRQVGIHAKSAGWTDGGRGEPAGADPVHRAICEACEGAPMEALRAMAENPRNTFDYGPLKMVYAVGEMKPMGQLAERVARERMALSLGRCVDVNERARRALAGEMAWA